MEELFEDKQISFVLTGLEARILDAVREHRNKIAGQKFSRRKMLAVILYEYRDELEIIDRDLLSEDLVNKKRDNKK